MPWCPNCKNEYREGITVCADCGAALVESLDEQKVVPLLTIDHPEAAEKLAEFMKYEGISLVTSRETEDGKIELSVPEDEKKEAVRLVQAFHSVEKEKELEAMSPEELAALEQETKERTEAARNVHTYVKAEDKYKDSKSSGYMFLIVGAAGLIFTALNAAGILSILSGWFSLGIAAVMFVVFLLVGISTLRHAGTLKEQIQTEDNLENEIRTWMDANLTEEALSPAIDPEASDEENDLNRFNLAKELLSKAYPELDDNFSDHLIDEFLN